MYLRNKGFDGANSFVSSLFRIDKKIRSGWNDYNIAHWSASHKKGIHNKIVNGIIKNEELSPCALIQEHIQGDSGLYGHFNLLIGR